MGWFQEKNNNLSSLQVAFPQAEVNANVYCRRLHPNTKHHNTKI